MGFGLGLGIAAGLGAVGSNVLGTFLNYRSQNKWAQMNYEQQERMFDYQKYLNNNQIQMQAADAQAAGINPLAMSGGSLSGGSYSNVSSPEVDTSGIADALGQIASLQNESEIAKKHNETQTNIANNQVKAQKYTADLDYEARQRQIESQERIALEKIASEERIALQKRTSDEKMHSERLDFEIELALDRAARENHMTKQESRDRYLKARSEAWELYNLIEQGVSEKVLKGKYGADISYAVSAFSSFLGASNKTFLKGKSKIDLFNEWFKDNYNFEEFKPEPMRFKRRGGR